MAGAATSTHSEPTTIPCLICETQNTMEAVICTNCCAHMALIQEALTQDRDPCIVTVVGDSNVGKTVYLGFLLDMLAKRADDFGAVPKGAYSVDLQHTVMTHLAGRRFPPKTPMEADMWHWAYYQIAHRRYPSQIFDLVMPDMAGEAIAAEIASPKTFAIIQSLLKKSAGAILLVDAALAATGSQQPDFFALKLMSYLDGLLATKGNQKLNTPIAIVLSKADYCPECFNDPRAFARTNLNRLWNICESRFQHVEFFATSVVGSIGFGLDEFENVVPYPLHAAPRGVLEPLVWTLSMLQQRA